MSNLARLKHYLQACVGDRAELRSSNGDFRRMRGSEARELVNMLSRNKLKWVFHIAVFKLDQAGHIVSMVSVGYKITDALYKDDLEDFVTEKCEELRNEEGGNLLTGWLASCDERITEISDELAMKTYAELHGWKS